MTDPASPSWRVDITQDGRGGTITYREPAGVISFHWEFGGGDTVAIIFIDGLQSWRTRHPWAAERRHEILKRIAHETVRQKAPACRADIDDQGGYIHILGK